MTTDLLETLAGPYLARPGVAWGADVLDRRVECAGQDLRRMVMRGREMREWVEMPPDRGAAEWEGLLAEAYAYVDAITP